MAIVPLPVVSTSVLILSVLMTPSGYLNQWNIRTYDDRTVAVLGGSSQNYQVMVVSRAERLHRGIRLYDELTMKFP